MRTVFADATYWIAVLDPRDSLHAVAIDASNALRPARIVTSELVLVEVLNALASYPQLRPTVVRTVRAISDDPNTEVVPLSGVQFREALTYYAARQDKSWGLTDCASFVLMQERGLSEALTHDRDFEQAGFTALLRAADQR
jgi:hypothetical protein